MSDAFLNLSLAETCLLAVIVQIIILGSALAVVLFAIHSFGKFIVITYVPLFSILIAVTTKLCEFLVYKLQVESAFNCKHLHE